METATSIPPPPPPPSGDPPPAVTAAPRPWGPARVFGGIAVLLVVVSIEAVIVSLFDPSLKSLAAKLVLQALLAATLVAVAFALASSPGGKRATGADLGLRRPRPGTLRLAAGAYIAYFAFAITYSQIVSPHQKDLTRDLGYGHGVFASIIAGILIVAAAPVSEEIFFRGFMFGGLRNRLPVVVAAIASAAIFGAFHYTGTSSLTVLPQLAALGLALAWLYHRSGSILPTIAIHLLNNALAFAILTH